MNLTVIDEELRALIALADRWQEQGYTPAIERDIALTRVRNIYSAMLLLQQQIDQQPQPAEIEVAPKLVAEQPDEEPAEEQVDESVEEPVAEQLVAEKLKAEAVDNKKFIHDLFCNDETFFEQEMHKISLLESMNEVLIYIGEKYAWAPDNATAEEFVAMFAKKFEDS